MQRRVLQQHHVQVNDESVVDVECGRSMSASSWQCEQTCSTHSRTAPSSLELSADTIVASPTTTSFSDDDSDWSAVDEPYHNRSVLRVVGKGMVVKTVTLKYVVHLIDICDESFGA